MSPSAILWTGTGADTSEQSSELRTLSQRSAVRRRCLHRPLALQQRRDQQQAHHRCPVRVANLADALLALVPTAAAGPLHLAGADGVSRYDFACLVAAAHGRPTAHLRTTTSAETAPQRPRDCRLDSGRAAVLLGAALPGVRAVLGSPRS